MVSTLLQGHGRSYGKIDVRSRRQNRLGARALTACAGSPDEYSLVSWLRTTENRDGPATLGSIGKSQSQALYHKEVIAFDVPVRATDYVFVPTLSSTFVMNRNPSPDSDEHLLYDVFVLADKDRTVDVRGPR